MQELKNFPNVFSERKGRNEEFFVKTNLNKSFFEERIVKENNNLFREVEPKRSKLFASIAKNVSQLGIKEDSVILYLGASHGYTVSFLSDVVTKGHIYALDFAPRVVRDLVFVCEYKENVAPMMEDANRPDNYKDKVEQVDVVFMDIAQKEQSKIFLKNCDMFLKVGGFGVLALKARSVDVTKNPKDVFKLTRAQLEKFMTIVDYRELAPFEMDHAIFVCKKNSDKSFDLELLRTIKVDSVSREGNSFGSRERFDGRKMSFGNRERISGSKDTKKSDSNKSYPKYDDKRVVNKNVLEKIKDIKRKKLDRTNSFK
jgi:fibrillarin-like pre-rRNA processing protein